ncbi:hypothetical protein TTHERM_00579210 (macronuclear) [Tetrahymena thermophila SB210]|uniref:Uncharacterized protein n=1 Tax=Tetrahymena thermophila (strain SB210) TaxID=312017 RepID=I7M387_TETTS|nr:hypothetical protein TTHERM_00579210 [Tetrahymena thermophila SB210]EAS02677.2 hypothetical protein TTHERM_00579210 [Tetrahymena thermophila SB210]|eukprot:XP_001022922.2 hypothetical protein TTHERM_00579210 [Tetrahymena thermophila SB210]
MQMHKSPKKFTLIYQKDQQDLYITDWSNTNQFASFIRSIFCLPTNSIIYLKDIVTNNIFDLAAFFCQEFYPQNTYQVIYAPTPSTSTPNKPRSNHTNGSQYGSSAAADFGGRDSSPHYIAGSGIMNASKTNISSNQFNATNPRASRSASYDLNHQIKYTNNNSVLHSNTNNNTIMQYDDTPTNMSRVIHDFEAFMHDTVPVNFYCVLFFDDHEQLKEGNSIAKQINQPFPNIEVYYSLYPSKRSKGAFVPSDSPYLFQLYHGKEMIFERELSIKEPINSELVDAINNFIKNTPKSSSIATQQDHLLTQDQQQQPINFFNLPSKTLMYSSQQQNSILPHEFKSDESPNLVSQDITFELIEILCQSRFRDIFEDDEFKYILKQVKKKNPDLITAYQNFKIFNDESELLQSLKQIAEQYAKKMTPTKMDVSFENKEKRSSLKKFKKGLSTQNKKWDLKTYKGIRKFLRDYNKNGILSVEDASIIVYCAHPSNTNNKEFLNMIETLQTFNNPDVILKIFQGYGRNLIQRIVEKYFEKKEVDQINSLKDDVLSPICGAFMNLRALGNIDEFLDILSKNLKCFDQKETSFSYNNNMNNNNQLVNCYSTITNNTNTPQSAPISNAPNQFSIPMSKVQSNLTSVQGSTRDLYQNQQQPIVYQSRMSRTEISNAQMTSIPESSEVNYTKEDNKDNQQNVQMDQNTQIALFAYSQIAKKKSGERRPTFSLGLNGNNVTRSRTESRRESKIQTNTQDQQIIEIIDQFHQAKDQVEFDDNYFEALRKLRNQINLNQQQDLICDKMYYNRYLEFVEILEKIKQDPNYLQYEQNKKLILNLIESKSQEFNDEEEESPLSKSPKVKNRRDKYLKFKNLLDFLFEKSRLISLKEFNTFNFLYTKEDINVLSAFEVYLHDQDLQDFTQTLKLIDQLYFFKNHLDYEEIEQFDESTNKQLTILFYLKKYISYEQAQALEKCIRFGDSMLFELYKKFKENRDKQQFIDKVKNYAIERKQELNEAEQKVRQQKQSINVEQIYMRELIDTFHERLMKDVDYVDLIYEMIDNDDPLIKSIFEVYNFTKDKQDLAQNTTLLYKHQFFKKLEQKAMIVLKDLNLLRNEEIKVIEKIKGKDIALVTAFNQYLENKNEQDFSESVYYLQY